MNKAYFEGWYFKHQKDNQIIAFIPSINVKENGKKEAYLQVIMNDNSYFFRMPLKQCTFDRKACYIKMGDNIFTKSGMQVNIWNKDLKIKGVILYENLSSIRYPVMGWFRYMPFMECKHEIISMGHQLDGSLLINQRKIDFSHGLGYMEKDWGQSFPKSYLWIQCNQFIKENACSVMISIARIPFYGFTFTGCICVIHYRGKEYRFTTYLGVKIDRWNQNEVYLKQGRKQFKIILDDRDKTSPKNNSNDSKLNFGYDLKAPLKGKMKRIIKEEHLVNGRFLMYDNNYKVFDITSDKVSYEFVE